MRGSALAVFTVAFVFASTALFVGPASAQGTATLDGMVCAQPYGYMPYPQSNEKGSECMYLQGLPDAVVTLTRSGTLPAGPSPIGPTQSTATTDANGQYRFSGLSAGDYTFKVTRQGFKDVSSTVTVGEGTRQDALLTGNPVDAKGKVTDPDGGAIAKATVFLCCGETGQVSATSGADGRYSASVQAGYWSFEVQAPGFQSSHTNLLVDGGDINFEMQRIPPQDGRIAGVVRDQDGNPVADARVAVYNYGHCCYAYDSDVSYGNESGASMGYSRPYYSGENHTMTDAQGRYSIGAYPGDNSMSVSKDGHAYHNRNVFVEKGGPTTADVELLKYPEKTARIEGKVVDARTGKGVPNLYVNLQSPEYGLSECSEPASSAGSDDRSSGSGGGSTGSADGAPAEPTMAPASYPYDPGCVIKTSPDGTFEGMVTPGYAILSVYPDWYASCSETSDADGSFRRDCGPEYYSFSVSRQLAADETTTFDVRLRSRPAPDAEVSGYVIDAETGDAIPNAQVSFSNQDTYGYGSATTDADGSYRLRLRSGYHSVSVWAEGHLRWEGVVDVPKGDTPFDVEVHPGTESYGGCCCCYYGSPMAHGAPEMAYASSDGKSSMGATYTGMAVATPSRSMGGDEQAFDSSGQGEQYEDLGGGLGPYDASERQAELEEPADGAPGVGLIALLAAIGAVFVLRRRLA